MSRPLESPEIAAPVAHVPRRKDPADLPIIALDIPVLYEDEGQDEMGESDIHRRCCEILANGLTAHLRDRPQYRVFSDLEFYYHPLDLRAHFSPDACAVIPYEPLPEEVTSYRIGREGPAPVVAIEVLSKRSAQQQDLTNKPIIYAGQGIAEYILVDVHAKHLKEKLLLKTLQPKDESWIDHRDDDGGVTSQLGFRVVFEDDGMIRVVDAKTGKGYLRPEELVDVERARQEAEAKRQQAEREKQQAEREKQQAQREKQQAEREKQQAQREKQQADERIRQLEEELKRSRGQNGN